MTTQNPYPEGSAEHEEWTEEAATVVQVPTHRRLTVSITIETLKTAKMLGTLSGVHYREIVGHAADLAVEAQAAKVRELLATQDPLPF